MFNALALHLKTNNILNSNTQLEEKRNVTLNFLNLKHTLRKIEETTSNDFLNELKVIFNEMLEEIKSNIKQI
ncbi:MAG: hypothetical protein COA66_01165 [Arcobacter sp.]|nr:MAG: hypothetical protein COA66_01165 [Arcobacter sp.]